jgi:hypothetical protein
MVETMIICIVFAVMLSVLLWERHAESRRLSGELEREKETNLELLRRIPATEKEAAAGPEPLTVEKIAEAVRTEGYVPETEKDCVRFKAQGVSYIIDTERLPLFFIAKGYSVDPKDWEMDLMKDAAHRMSDALVMVKATFLDNDKTLNFFVAAQDRNYGSFRANLATYLRILEDGQRKMSEEYDRLVDEKRGAALTSQPVFPAPKSETKILS